MSAVLSSHRAFVHIFLCLRTCGLILITLLKRKKKHTSDCIKQATLDLHNSGWKHTSFCCPLLQFQNIWFKLCVHVCVCKTKDILFLFPDLCASLSPPPPPTLSLPHVFFQTVRTGGKWDLPALCWSCSTSLFPRVWRWSLRGAQVCVLSDAPALTL